MNEPGQVIIIRKPIWRWYMFGEEPNLLVVELCAHVPWWRRLITRILFGSKWERV